MLSRPGARLRRAAARAHADFRYTLSASQRSALVAFASFTMTEAVTRSVTWSIRRRPLPGPGARRAGLLRDLSVAGVHIHHYLPGMALLAGTGALAVRGTDRLGVHCLIGAGYGAGCALVVDEAPLLVNLRDVYWSREGRWAIDLALGIVGVTGTYFAGLPLWRGIAEELRAAEPPHHAAMTGEPRVS
jgi:hypothetical protein